MQAALLTIDDKSQSNSWEFLHKLAVAATTAGDEDSDLDLELDRVLLESLHQADLAQGMA